MSWIQWLETKRLVTAAPNDSVARAVDLMVEGRVGSVLVVQDGRLTGIFSERDVLTRVLAPGRDPRTTLLSEVCTSDPRVVREDAELAECARLIKTYKVRHVPVVDERGRPVGMLSVRDFLHYVLDEIETLIEKAYREQRLEQLTDPYGSLGERDLHR